MKPAQSDSAWVPLEPQRLTAWRRYMAPDGHPATIEESIEITAEMIDAGARALLAEEGFTEGIDENDLAAWRGHAEAVLRSALDQEGRDA